MVQHGKSTYKFYQSDTNKSDKNKKEKDRYQLFKIQIITGSHGYKIVITTARKLHSKTLKLIALLQ